MRELCLPVGLSPDDLKQLDSVIGSRARLKKGESLYRAGEPFHALYAVRLGSLKTTVLAEDGREQVAGYHMLGDIIGLDGIATNSHTCSAIALEDTEVCAIAFDRLEELMQMLTQRLSMLFEFAPPDFYERSTFASYIDTLLETGLIREDADGSLSLHEHSHTWERYVERLLPPDAVLAIRRVAADRAP